MYSLQADAEFLPWSKRFFHWLLSSSIQTDTCTLRNKCKCKQTVVSFIFAITDMEMHKSPTDIRTLPLNGTKHIRNTRACLLPAYRIQLANTPFEYDIRWWTNCPDCVCFYQRAATPASEFYVVFKAPSYLCSLGQRFVANYSYAGLRWSSWDLLICYECCILGSYMSWHEYKLKATNWVVNGFDMRGYCKLNHRESPRVFFGLVLSLPFYLSKAEEWCVDLSDTYFEAEVSIVDRKK